jgi:hypothetical protein
LSVDGKADLKAGVRVGAKADWSEWTVAAWAVNSAAARAASWADGWAAEKAGEWVDVLAGLWAGDWAAVSVGWRVAVTADPWVQSD